MIITFASRSVTHRVLIKLIVTTQILSPKQGMKQTTLPTSWIRDAEEVSSSESSFSDDEVADGRLEPVLEDFTEEAYVEIHVFHPPARYVPLRTRAFIDALVEHLPPGSVRFSCEIDEIAPVPDGWNIGDEATFDALVLACPAYAAARLLRDSNPQLAAELDAVEYASCATVNLLYDASAVGRTLEGFGFFVARSEGSPLLACNYTSLKFDDRAPSGCVLLRAFIGGAGRDPIDDLEEGQLVQIAHEALARLLDLRGAPRFGRSRRFPSAMPQMVLGSLERRQRLASTRPGLAICGSAIGAVGLPDCIESAESAAQQITGVESQADLGHAG